MSEFMRSQAMRSCHFYTGGIKHLLRRTKISICVSMALALSLNPREQDNGTIAEENSW